MLIDWTGKRTKFGYWDPVELNGSPNPSRGSNSLQVIGFLSAAHAICDSADGLPRPENSSFGQSLVQLVRDHGYDYNMQFAHTTTPTCLFATYVDRLSWLSYLLIMDYAPELVWTPDGASDGLSRQEESSGQVRGGGLGLTPAELNTFRSRFATSLLSYWNSTALSTQEMRLGLWDSIVQLLLRRQHSPERNPDWMLQRWPMELIDWPVRNSQRLDVSVDPDFAHSCSAVGPRWQKPSRPLPPDESVLRDYGSFATEGAWALDAPLWVADSGQAGPPGLREETPTTYLMEYWFKRYKGILLGASPMR